MFTLLFLLVGAVNAADEVKLRADHPDRYVVVKGDTLWDISERFLMSPWLWPEVWQANPQIENPHLIYPGDVITLIYVQGKPKLVIERKIPTVKLSPQIRAQRIEQPIPLIPIDTIRQFLNENRVVGKNEFDNAPYVVAHDELRLATASGDKIYARGITSADQNYSILRLGDAYTDPDSKELLGYEAVHVGNAKMLRSGDPATFKLSGTNREVQTGDHLLPILETPVLHNYLPHAPKTQIKGRIISIFDAVFQAGRDQVITINLGERDGMEIGHVLAIDRAGDEIVDSVKGGTVQLPDEQSGLLMVFRTFEKVSYALILESSRAIHILDSVRTP
ncbi:LysM peptidoglycan-binding domain-containing protein [Candidatus Reidiella endopervernicosa]|uniref:LysM peptidoglycan-binding domain-containing protein n=1 Tax=Candidatus Reidiella endopervernicosa TaxID=2738883 RepID=A0A6N0I0J6_9GAMM|nr:LysM peptidoglycan-binding domain-containing protein [Candidatus Reidiella endopervernicosa]